MEDDLEAIILRNQRRPVPPPIEAIPVAMGDADDDDQGRLNLWALPAHVLESETSREAATKIKNSAPHIRGRVYDLIKASRRYGRTDEEVQIMMALNPSTQRPRRVELVRAGAVFDSGRKRKTKSGRRAVVWIAAQFVEGAGSVDEGDPGGEG